MCLDKVEVKDTPVTAVKQLIKEWFKDPLNHTLSNLSQQQTEPPLFWPPDMKSWLIGKVPDAGKDWGQKKKRVSEDEMAGWHHCCKAHEFG